MVKSKNPGNLICWHCPLQSDTRRLAQALAASVVDVWNNAGDKLTASIWLQGELGAGKTTLVRELLVALGVTGRIKSPTYSLVEEYEGSLVDGLPLVHLDLYRLSAAEELEYIGVPEVLADALVLIEWPQQGQGYLPEPDLIIKIEDQPGGRMFMLQAQSEIGRKLTDYNLLVSR